MKGRPLKLYLSDGTLLGSGLEAAAHFHLTPGRISHYIQEARDEGKNYAMVKNQRLYMVDPAKIKREPIKPITFRPENVLLVGHVTRNLGVWR
jgi:hypothetical protein